MIKMDMIWFATASILYPNTSPTRAVFSLTGIVMVVREA